METGILHTHVLIVSLYILQLLIKVILLATGKTEQLDRFNAKTKIPHMVLAVLMLVTGTYLLIASPAASQNYIIIKLVLVFGAIPVGIVGMKKKNVALAALSLLMMVGAMVLAYTKPQIGAGGNSSGTEEAKGMTVYMANCQRCHGDDGKAGFQGAKDLASSTISDDEVRKIIGEGKGVMPSTTLNETEMNDLVDFVKGLRK